MYQAIYYWMYNYLSKITSNRTPAFNAFLLIVLLEGMNLISIGRCIYNTTHFNSDGQTVVILAGIVVLGIMGFNFFYLYQRKDNIFKEVKEYPESKFRLSKNVFWIYSIASVFVIVLVVASS